MHSVNRSCHDVVVVVARVAGSATAMLLARLGHDVVVVVDQALFPSDTISTHSIARSGVVQLHRWGLLDGVLDSGAPAIRQVTFNAGGESVSRPIKDKAGVDLVVGPRRYVLDTILVGAAARAGAPVELPGGTHPDRVGVQQHAQQRLGVVGGMAVPVGAVGAQERLQVELVGDVEDEPGEVAFGEPVAQVGRQQEGLVTVPTTEVVGHGAFYKFAPLAPNVSVLRVNSQPVRGCPAGGRSHSDTVVGSMVRSTTATSSAESVSRSISSRRRALNASIVLTAS